MSMNKVIFIFTTLFIGCCAYAADGALRDDLNIDLDVQIVEMLESLRANLECKSSQEKVQAIFDIVECLKLNNVSDEEIVKFIKTSATVEKPAKNHSKVKIFAHVFALIALAVLSYKAYCWHNELNKVRSELADMSNTINQCKGLLTDFFNQNQELIKNSEQIRAQIDKNE